MSPTERQTLRDKHAACFADTYKDQYVCRSCSSDDLSTHLVYYPCDIIKTLNWAEWLLEELKSISAMRTDQQAKWALPRYVAGR